MADNDSLKERIGAGAMVVCVAAPLDSATGVRISFRNGTPDQRQKYIDMGVTVFLERPQV